MISPAKPVTHRAYFKETKTLGVLMKYSRLTCHCCGETFYRAKGLTLALIGFIWNPAMFDSPGNLYDLCPECKKLFIISYLGLQEKRKAEIRQQKSATWKVRIEATASCREASATDGSKFAPNWNYSQKEQDHPARIHRNREEQKIWRF